MRLPAYLTSGDSFGTRRRAATSYAVLLVWVVIVLFVSFEHEVWRDEVRALSVAIQPDSLHELPRFLKNEGHPALWYVLLRLGFGVTHTTAILQILSLLIALAAVAVFLRYAPFAGWQKLLFLGGVFSLYEYSVTARNYGIAMLLLFLFALLYEKREKRPFLAALLLFFLANANAVSCIFAGILLLMWIVDDLAVRRERLTIRLTASWLFVLAGVGLAIWTCLPTPDSVLTRPYTLSRISSAVVSSTIHPSRHFNYLWYGVPAVIADLLLWLLVLGLAKRATLAASLGGAMVAMGTFFRVVYPGYLRHQGMFLIFALTLFWILKRGEAPPGERRPAPLLRSLRTVSLSILLPALLLIQGASGAFKIRRDITQDLSSSRDFSEFIDAHPEYHDAILMGEPDYLLESLPYYLSNRIYIPREGAFRNYTLFTMANRQTLSMGELLESAEAVERREGKPVLLLFGHFDIADGSLTRKEFGYAKAFTCSPEERALFLESTRKVAEFKDAANDENYAVYALR